MDIQEVIDLKKQLEEEFKKDTEAIDRVLALLEKRQASKKTEQQSEQQTKQPPPASATEQTTNEKSIQNGGTPPTHQPELRKFAFVGDEDDDAEKKVDFAQNGDGSNGSENKFGRARDSGVRGIAKQVVNQLPEFFTRKDLISAMSKQFPDMTDKFTKDAVTGALRRLVEDDLIVVHQAPGGKSPIVYRNLSPTVI
jgi:septum formation inhibitor MinC